MSNLYGFSIDKPVGTVPALYGFSINIIPILLIRTINGLDEIVTGSTIELYQNDILIVTLNSNDGHYVLTSLDAGTYEIVNSESDRRQEFIFNGTTFELIDYKILGITKNYRVRAKLSDIGDYPSDYSNILTVRV